ncbi:MAG: xanthine dehydrogenase molybdopterin binding subunit [Bacteroidetes bacterium RIFOXYC12_FULL_35_7]|nr:MAG: xanthine dehydrogenase molybdopterin binding subunit [Bacteroidetes bacterium RIFOXYC12_FULL_35_7]
MHGFVYTSPHAHARIISFDLEEAKKVKGVHAILSHKDIPGHNNMGPVFHDEPALAFEKVECIGQAVFLIAAESEEAALEAKKVIKIEYEILPAVVTIEESIEKNMLLQPERKIECGNVEEAFKNVPHILEGELITGGQEHWYLETQICLCVPGEGNDIKAYSSTQNPMETQAIIAEVLGVQKNEVEVEMRRMGGAFGGKETQGNHLAAWAALLVHHTKRPVKVRLQRDEDQLITGKRHPFLFKYKAGFDNDGKILAIDVLHYANGGYASDLSMAILERAMLHAENSYFIPNMRIIGKAMKTNLPSNVAFRGFGGPQGMACVETIIDKIARILKKDAAEIRYKNFYGLNERNTTPYGQTVENNRLYVLWEQLMNSSSYEKRKKDIEKFNNENEFYKKGIALTPVKFGISFTSSFLNQAGALVNIYTDGTLLVNHGGSEMGQGLNTKIQQIAALEMGVSIDKIKVNATNTSKVPNTSATAASSGSDLNGAAVKDAIEKLKYRLIPVAAKELRKNNVPPTDEKAIVFENNVVYDSQNPDRKMSFLQLVSLAYIQQVSMSATGFYKTPDIHFDRATGKGKPFHYFAFGMAVSEVQVDILTGRVQLLRSDILHDVGESIIPNIDKGQVEGAFIQGVGWVTSEEMKYDAKGYLLNHSPDTYKIPSIQDIPADFRVELLKGYPNPNAIRKSKAVGEPPIMLAFSVWLAIKDAISSIKNHKIEPDFCIPATNENILLSIEKLPASVSKTI